MGDSLRAAIPCKNPLDVDDVGDMCGRSTYGTWSMTGESLWPWPPWPLIASMCRPDCVANVWDMTSVLRDEGGPMLGGPGSPGENTVQSCFESSGISVGGLRRARRFPVPGFAICP